MRVARFMARAEPGIDHPLAGVGDQAVTVGPAIMVRTGDDLVTIVLSGVDARIEKAKLIFTTVARAL